MNEKNIEKPKSKLNKIFNNLITLSLVVVLGVLLYNYFGDYFNLLNTDKKYKKMEKELISKTKSYVEEAGIKLEDGADKYITFTELNYTPSQHLDCSDTGGVLVTRYYDDFEYSPYYTCSEYTSDPVRIKISDNDLYSKYIKLNGENPLRLTINEIYQEPGYVIEDENYMVNVDENVGNVPGIYYVTYTVTTPDTTSTVTRAVFVEDIGEADKYNKPIIELNGNQLMSLVVGDKYVEPGYKVTDNIDGDLTSKVVISGKVDTSIKGTYILTYTITNSAGTSSQTQRTIIVNPNASNALGSLPKISLNGSGDITLTVGNTYKEPGYSATDSKDGDITSKVTINGKVDTSTPGTYALTYIVTNSQGYTNSVTRRVIVNFKKTDNNNNNQNNNVSTPKLVLKGNSTIILTVGDTYKEPGYSATDSKDGDITSKVTISGKVETKSIASYTLVYTVKNSDNVTSSVTRTVIVNKKAEETVSTPVISLKGNNPTYLTQGETYTDSGYSATDSKDGNITNKVTVSGKVDTNKVGTYTIVYSVKNSSNKTDSISRTVIVKQKESPVNVNITQNTTKIVNTYVAITLTISGDGYDYTILPSGQKVTLKTINYSATDNGNYNFIVYNKSGSSKTYTSSVTNIDKAVPTATCTGTATSSKTTVSVSASDNMSGVNAYQYSGGSTSSNFIKDTTYTFNSKQTSVIVKISDNAGNIASISCSITDTTAPTNPTNPSTPIPGAKLEFHVIDISAPGFGDALIIRTPSNRVILVDGGQVECKDKVLSYIKNLGITSIDLMIASHLHGDHIGGLTYVLKELPVSKVLLHTDLNTCNKAGICGDSDAVGDFTKAVNKYMVNAGKPVKVATVGQTETIGELNLLFVGPQTVYKVSDAHTHNDNSLNFVFTYGSTKFMFTGDGIQQDAVLANYSSAIANLDVLKYPHHTLYSLKNQFMDVIRPKWVLASADINGFATSDKRTATRKYLENNFGSKIRLTYSQGNMLIQSDGTKITYTKDVKAKDYKRSCSSSVCF